MGILRHGRLVDEGTSAQLRHLRGQTVDVTFSGPAPTMPALPASRSSASATTGYGFETTEGVGLVIAALAVASSRDAHQPGTVAEKRSSCTTTPSQVGREGDGNPAKVTVDG